MDPLWSQRASINPLSVKLSCPVLFPFRTGWKKIQVLEAKIENVIELLLKQKDVTEIPLPVVLAVNGTSQRRWGERLSLRADSETSQHGDSQVNMLFPLSWRCIPLLSSCVCVK